MREFEYTPTYLHLERAEIRRRAGRARAQMGHCHLCPYACHANRNQTAGACGIAAKARLVSFIPDFGELPVLAGWRGSGLVLFEAPRLSFHSSADWPGFLRPDVRQGLPPASATEAGKELEPAELASLLLKLQDLGCHNINLLPPTYVIPAMLQALALAIEGGLHLPLIYNTQGYESWEALRLLEGIVDLFATDMLVGRAHEAQRYLKLPDYPRVNRAAVREMHRQVGDLLLSSEGLALRGLLVRHHVLPNEVAGTARVARFLAREISPDTALYLLNDYVPTRRGANRGALGRRPLPQELVLARCTAEAAGLRRLLPGPLTTIRIEGVAGQGLGGTRTGARGG